MYSDRYGKWESNIGDNGGESSLRDIEDDAVIRDESEE